MKLPFSKPHSLRMDVDHEHKTLESYLQDGTLPAELVGRLFAAAAKLREIEVPSSRVRERLIRVDIPEVGLMGYNLVFIPHKRRHNLMFLMRMQRGGDPTKNAERYREMAEESGMFGAAGVETLTIEWCPARHLPKGLRREVDEHGWPAAPDGSYPLYWHFDPGTSEDRFTMSEGLFHGLVASLEALLELHKERPELLRGEGPCVPFELEYRGTDGVAVFFGYPGIVQELRHYDAPGWATEPRMLSYGLMAAILDLTESEGGREWRKLESVRDHDSLIPLCLEWMIFRYPINGRVPVDAYLETRREQFSERQLNMMELQRNSPATLWEMMSEPDEDLMVTMRSLETGEEYQIPRKDLGMLLAVPGQMFLARIVEFEGEPLLTGRAMIQVRPDLAKAIFETAERRTQRRKGDRADFERNLFAGWIEQEAAASARPHLIEYTQPLEDPEKFEHMELFVDYHLIPLDSFRYVAGVIHEMEITEECFRTKREGEMIFDAKMQLETAGADGRVSGAVHENYLRVSTLDTATADAYAAAIKDEFEFPVQPLIRQHWRWAVFKSDNPEFGAHQLVRMAGPGPMHEQIDHALPKFYKEWTDEPRPEYGGLTRRQALTTEEYRNDVEWELRQIVFEEYMNPDADARFDTLELRAELLAEADGKQGDTEQ